MIDLTVKTLDSQNHTFSLNDDITVRQFKEHIAETVSIPADLQRLIYCGRVLQDEKNLNEYDVNGKVIHLVQRLPPSLHQRPNNAGQNNSHSQSSQGGTWQSGPRIQYRQTQFHGNPMYVGSVSIPADVLDRHDAEWPTPQFSGILANSHLTVVRRMLDQANRVIDRLENASDTSDEATTPQTSAPSDGAAAESTPTPVEDPQPTPDEPEPATSGEATPTEGLLPRQLSELVRELLTTRDRLTPYIRDRILSPTSSTPEENQRIMDGVSECFHFLSHAEHALSNISIDMQQTPPRTLRCRPMNIRPPAIVQAGLPIQVEAHISLHGQTDNNSADNDPPPTQPPQPTSANTEATGSSTQTSQPQSNPERSGQSDSPFGQVFNFPNNVEVVMEMSPQAPRVWSFSSEPQPQGANNNNNNNTNNNNTTNANNNNTSNAAGTSAGFSWGAPSPDIIRHLMQAVAGYMAETRVPMPAPSTGAPSTTSSTATSATPTVGCLRHRPRTVAGESASSQPRGNTDTHPTTSTQTRTTSRTHVLQHAQALGVGLDVADSIDFDPFLPCTSQHVRRQPAQTSTAASTQTGGAGGDPPVQNQAGGTLGGIRGPRFATITGVQLVNSSAPTLAESMANVRPTLGTSISDVLASRGIYLSVDLPPTRLAERTIHMSIYRVLSGLSVGDWYRIVEGDYSPLSLRIQRKLRIALRENNTSVSEGDLPNRIAETLIRELRGYLEYTFNWGIANDERGAAVALRETVENVLNVHVAEIVRCIFTDYDTSTAFVEAVIEPIKALASNLIGVCRLTLSSGVNEFVGPLPLIGPNVFERCAIRFANQMTQGMPPLFREWIMETVLTWVCRYARTVQSPPTEEITKFLCYKDQPQTNSRPSQAWPAASQATSTVSSAPAPQSTAQSVPEPMETDSGPDPLMLDENEEVSTTFPGHENLLPDWVPIIARDGARQRRQLQLGLSGGSVTTLSDAYLATMPSKRRKLVEQQKPTLLASPTSNSSAIPASMERLIRESVGRAGVEEVDGAAAAVASDSTARRAFGEAIRECLHPNRYQSPDFPDPLRFPNATRFFSDHDRHDKQ
ncbi:large proline-rich protein bag6-B [Diachasma alloeum]|uniref:large proline-rich protein bag6-B n=1 Tax=Diachasma alloeum TaxID=454923 RepID=UPI0007383D58|nr:large proline-rich protein bag6-B [Diachasma alloeum]